MERLRTRLMSARLAVILVALAAGAGLAAAGNSPGDEPAPGHPGLPGPALRHLVRRRHRRLPTRSSRSTPTQTFGGLPSLRFEVVGPNNWWWNAILAGQDWMPYTVEHYRTGGYLEFNVKGAVGGEMFTLALGDLDNARVPMETTLDSVGSWDYVSVTTEWQHVSIPLSALMPDDRVVPLGTFEPRQLRVLTFAEPYWGSYAKTFWLNDIKFTSPDREPSAPAIRVNQVGYLPLAEKYAYVADFPEALVADVGTRFEVRRAADDAVAHTGTLTARGRPRALRLGGEGPARRLQPPVAARGVLPGGRTRRASTGRRASAVDWRLYKPALRDAMRYYFYQRQGIAIEEPFAEGFARGLGHPGDTTARMRSTGAVRDVSQGWYDAGDYGKYTPFAAAPIVDLLDAHGTFPFVFGDDTNIPESGNGTGRRARRGEVGAGLAAEDAGRRVGRLLPPRLPEQLPVLRLLPAGGHHRAALRRGPDGRRAERPPDGQHREGGGRAGPRGASLQARRPAYADRLLAAAEAGWAYLVANPQNIPATGFNGEQSTDDAERLWAAAELFRATKDVDVRLATSAPATGTTPTSGPRRPTTPPRSRCGRSSPTSRRPAASQEVRTWFRPLYRGWREQQLARARGTWRNFLDDGSGEFGSDYYWGSNSVTLQTIVVIATGRPGDRRSLRLRAAQGGARAAQLRARREPAAQELPHRLRRRRGQPDLLEHLQQRRPRADCRPASWPRVRTSTRAGATRGSSASATRTPTPTGRCPSTRSTTTRTSSSCSRWLRLPL